MDLVFDFFTVIVLIWPISSQYSISIPPDWGFLGYKNKSLVWNGLLFCGSNFDEIYFGDSYLSLSITFQQNLLEFHHASVMFFEIGPSQISIQQFYFPATFQIVCIVCNSFL